MFSHPNFMFPIVICFVKICCFLQGTGMGVVVYLYFVDLTHLLLKFLNKVFLNKLNRQ